ncbi:MAG: endoribonuclease MazF [Candidatus Binataceae bacterium]
MAKSTGAGLVMRNGSKVPSTYVPQRGDIVYVDFDPQAGREQKGRRPALVLSPHEYNRRTGLAIACPVTSRIKGYPFEVQIPAGGKVHGVVLADHIKSLDWRTRRAELADKARGSVLDEITAKLAPLLFELQ